ncbi:MAG: hypothetical protein AB7O91_05240 [Sphingomonas sp.]
MELLLALLIQSSIAPAADAGRMPRLSYATEAGQRAPQGPRINQGRSAQIDWEATDESLAAEARRERGRRSTPARPASGRSTTWNGVPARIIDGRAHGLW